MVVQGHVIADDSRAHRAHGDNNEEYTRRQRRSRRLPLRLNGRTTDDGRMQMRKKTKHINEWKKKKKLRTKKRSSNNPGRPLGGRNGRRRRGRTLLLHSGLSLFKNIFPTQGHHGRDKLSIEPSNAQEEKWTLLFTELAHAYCNNARPSKDLRPIQRCRELRINVATNYIHDVVVRYASVRTKQNKTCLLLLLVITFTMTACEINIRVKTYCLYKQLRDLRATKTYRDSERSSRNRFTDKRRLKMLKNEKSASIWIL